MQFDYINYNNFNISHYKEIPSTNSLAFRLAKSGEVTHNHIIIAEKQSAGRGRGSRSWESIEGNLFLSLVLKPQRSINTISQISFLAAVSIGETISSLNKNNEVSLSYKWPNDILLNNKKVCGILLESDLRDNLVNFIILGLGVNINSHPNNANYPTTSLIKEGVDLIDKEYLLHKFLDNFSILYQKWLDFGFLPIRNLWLDKAYKLDKKININLPNKKLVGIFKGLDPDGNLVIQVNNEIKLISSGEIFD